MPESLNTCRNLYAYPPIFLSLHKNWRPTNFLHQPFLLLNQKRSLKGYFLFGGKGSLDSCSQNDLSSVLFEQVHDLGLEKNVLSVSSSHPAARSRFIYSREKLHQLPSGVISIIKRQSLFSKSLLPTIIREPFVRGKQDHEDESIYNFFKRRMNEEVCAFTSFHLSQCILILMFDLWTKAVANSLISVDLSQVNLPKMSTQYQ